MCAHPDVERSEERRARSDERFVVSARSPLALRLSLLALLLLAASALAQQAETPEQMFARAEDLRRRGQRDEAVALYQQVIAVSPEHVLAHKYYQEIMIALGSEKEILQYYRDLLASDPQKPVYHLLLGKLLGDDDALVEFTTCVELDPKFFWGHWAMAGILLRQGKLAEAEAKAREAQGLLDNEYSRTMLGAILAKKAATDREHGSQHLEAAKRELQRAISINRDYDPAFLTLGTVFAMGGKYPEAIKALEMGMKLNPSEPGFAQALAQVNAENGKGLLEIATRLVKMRQDYLKDGKPQQAMESLFEAKERAHGAIVSFERVLEYAPTAQGARERLAAAHFVMGNLLLMEVGELTAAGKYPPAIVRGDEAVTEMNKAMEVDPANEKVKDGPAVALLARANAWLGQGNALLTQGAKAEARAALEKALADAQGSAGAAGVLAKVQEQARKLSSAILEALAKAKE